MEIEELFGKELNKKLKKTHKSHSGFVDDNRELKNEFKKNFNTRVLQRISDVVINDVIALLALGLSIEDERIYAWIVEREQR